MVLHAEICSSNSQVLLSCALLQCALCSVLVQLSAYVHMPANDSQNTHSESLDIAIALLLLLISLTSSCNVIRHAAILLLRVCLCPRSSAESLLIS